MPTLFRLLATIGVLVAMGYATLFAVATFLRPEPREIIHIVDLPQAATLTTGRSAARALDAEARRLAPKRSYQ